MEGEGVAGKVPRPPTMVDRVRVVVEGVEALLQIFREPKAEMVVRVECFCIFLNTSAW